MENLKLVDCFKNLLLDYINQGERGEVASFNAIKSGLNILINVSEKNGPPEEMSLIYAIVPEIISVVNEKSEDFSNDILMIHEAQENFERFFNGELSDPDPLSDDFRDFINFIKEKKRYMKDEIELRKNMQKIMHNQKENS